MTKQFLFLMLFLLYSAPCFALQITFVKEASVATDYVTLGDIVSFDESTAVTKSLATAIIGESPHPGESLLFNAVEIRDQILRQTALPHTTLWTGSSVVAVSRPGQEVLPDDLLNALDTFLDNNQHALPQAEIRFLPRSLPLPFKVPEGNLSIEVIPSNPSILGSSRISFIVRVDGKTRENLSMQGQLQALAPVAVAKSSLRRGTILTPENIVSSIKDLAEHKDPVTDLRTVLGKRLKRSIREDNVINASDVDFPPLVMRGQLVKILFNHKNIHISATGIANMNGKMNEIIQVRNASSNKLIFCRVTAPGIVEVAI
jgi:flagellar basal body P-ring formation protein FlgA